MTRSRLSSYGWSAAELIHDRVDRGLMWTDVHERVIDGHYEHSLDLLQLGVVDVAW